MASTSALHMAALRGSRTNPWAGPSLPSFISTSTSTGMHVPVFATKSTRNAQVVLMMAWHFSLALTIKVSARKLP